MHFLYCEREKKKRKEEGEKDAGQRESVTFTAGFLELMGGFFRATWNAVIMSPVHYCRLRKADPFVTVTTPNGAR